MEPIGDTAVERVRGERLRVLYFPSQMPGLNPTDQCWNQFTEWSTYRFIEALDESKTALSAAFESIAEPDNHDYICHE